MDFTWCFSLLIDYVVDSFSFPLNGIEQYQTPLVTSDEADHCVFLVEMRIERAEIADQAVSKSPSYIPRFFLNFPW